MIGKAVSRRKPTHRPAEAEHCRARSAPSSSHNGTGFKNSVPLQHALWEENHITFVFFYSATPNKTKKKQSANSWPK